MDSRRPSHEDCVCDAVEEIACLLSRKRHDPVVVATTGGDVKFGWVEKVDDEVLILKFVAFYSPACPCAPLYAYRAFVPLYQITDVLDAPKMADTPYEDAFRRIESWRQNEGSATNPNP